MSATVRVETPLRRFLSEFVESKLALFGLCVFTVIALLAVFAHSHFLSSTLFHRPELLEWVYRHEMLPAYGKRNSGLDPSLEETEARFLEWLAATR